jgi:hypothetical protein
MVWLYANWALIVSALFAVSELLALIPAVKSNSVFQLVYNALKGMKEKILPRPPVQ